MRTDLNWLEPALRTRALTMPHHNHELASARILRSCAPACKPRLVANPTVLETGMNSDPVGMEIHGCYGAAKGESILSDTIVLAILGVVTLLYFGLLATAHVWMVPREHLPKRKSRPEKTEGADESKPGGK